MRVEQRLPGALAEVGAALLSMALLPLCGQAQVVINEVLAGNHFTGLDDDGDSSDWVELLNNGSNWVQLGGFALSDSADHPDKWVFPDVVLGPHEHFVVWCSGKDRTDLNAAYLPFLPFTPTLIPGDVEWSYLTAAPDAGVFPAKWNELDFDDSAWSKGKPGFGFGDDDDTTVLPQGIGAVLLRHVFEVAPGANLSNIVIEACYDDGFVLFLNGVRVLSVDSREEEELSFASTAARSRECVKPERFLLPEASVVVTPGKNVVAVVLLNAGATNNDLSFAPALGQVQPSVHTSFKLKSEGDDVFLTDAGGNLVDSLKFPPQVEDHSYGKSPDGGSELAYLAIPTPGAENDRHSSPEPISSEPLFSPEGGKQSKPIEVSITSGVKFADAEIRYTTTGEPPTASSLLYEGPIPISKDTVIRATVFLGGGALPPTVSRSYFLSAQALDLALPILSVSMDPKDFRAVHLNSAARGRASERPGYMEILNASGSIDVSSGFGLRLHGGSGREGSLATKKYYRAYFRDVYGDSKLEYPLIPDTSQQIFDKVVLRANLDDAFRETRRASLIRDQTIRDLFADMGSLDSHGSWYNLYVNMEYRGIYNVVERMDKEFFHYYLPEAGQDWDVIRTSFEPLEGTRARLTGLMNFIQRNDLRHSGLFDQAAQLIDVKNFTDYLILNIWGQNHDWPDNNWYVACPQTPDGKWISLCWDAEYALGLNPAGFNTDTFTYVLSSGNNPFSPVLGGLLNSPAYQQYFLDELDRQLLGALAPDNVIAHLRRLASIIEHDIPYEAALTGNTLMTWQRNLSEMETFALKRGPIIRRFVANSKRMNTPGVFSASPARFTLEGEVEVLLKGRRFTEGTTILFAGLPSPLVTLVSPEELRAVVPFDARLEGFPEIEVADRAGPLRSFASGLIEVSLVHPEVASIEPASGRAEGGELVIIRGANFLPGVRVELGGVAAPSTVRQGEKSDILEVVTPPGVGRVKVRVINTTPGEVPSATNVEFSYVSSAFVRADVDGNGQVEITDPIKTLRYLIGQDGNYFCEDAMDADDSGNVNLSDVILVLDYLFLDRAIEPAAPRGECGPDPTADTILCVGPSICPWSHKTDRSSRPASPRIATRPWRRKRLNSPARFRGVRMAENVFVLARSEGRLRSWKDRRGRATKPGRKRAGQAQLRIAPGYLVGRAHDGGCVRRALRLRPGIGGGAGSRRLRR